MPAFRVLPHADAPAPAPSAPLPGLLASHLFLPMGLAAVAAVLLWHGGDQRWADLLYRAEGGHWALRGHWLTAGLLHRGGRLASLLAACTVLGSYAHALHCPARARLRLPLLYLLLALVAATTTVSLLKSVTGIDCPWDLVGYGGAHRQHALWQAIPAGQPAGRCFPAGHASAGYAWVSLYFFAHLLGQPRRAWPGLATAILAGAVLGLGQQLRGAHFLSHDLASLAVCWGVSLGLFLLFRARPGQGAAVEAAP